MMDKVTEAIINKLPRLISQRPLEWARTKPDHPAIVEDKVSWTYRDLAIAVEKSKHLLTKYGIRPGDRSWVEREPQPPKPYASQNAESVTFSSMKVSSRDLRI